MELILTLLTILFAVIGINGLIYMLVEIIDTDAK